MDFLAAIQLTVLLPSSPFGFSSAPVVFL